MKIWAHTLVKNEARWLWYSVSSVIEQVDRLLLWDTGSTDGSIEIEQELKRKFPGKIELNFRKQSTAEDFTNVRQEMLEATKSDWFLVVDGDEIWWRDSIKKVIEEINKNGKKKECLAVPAILPVGDIFHRQEEKAGGYKLAGKVGHVGLRGINRKIPGLNALGPHGQMGWADKNGKMIQEHDPKNIIYVDAPFLHTTYLPRAGGRKDEEVIKRLQKRKHELGDSFPREYFYPEVFFEEKPAYVKSPWEVMDNSFKAVAFFETPLRKLKRRLLPPKVGY